MEVGCPFNYMADASPTGAEKTRQRQWTEECHEREYPMAEILGFPQHELHQIERFVYKHRTTLMDAWHDYFGA